jgi:hypothetical protein
MSSARPTVLVGAALAAQPGNGGHAWVILHWLLGLRRIGYDVHLLDRQPEPCDHAGPAWLEAVLGPHGLTHSFTGSGVGGEDRRRLVTLASESVGLLNVMGYIDDPDVLGAVPRRAFIDIDPGFGQFWFDLGLADVFAGHDAFATVGLHIGADDCRVPTCGREWITTPPPVVVDAWRGCVPPSRGITTVATWRGIYGPVVHAGHKYGLRVHEFRRFLGLAHRSALPLEPALRIDPADSADRAALEAHGWYLRDPSVVADTPTGFARFVAQSTAELCIAKQLYVDARTGWFSDRSACYLAAGRPVVAQDTGLAGHLPTGAGLLTFDSPDGAVAAMRSIDTDWETHSRAARQLAEEHLDAECVLPTLLARLGIEAA